MALVVTNSGEVIALEYLVNKDAPEDLVLRLFQSNTTPAETDVTATYTEANFTGYSAITLTGASWGAGSGGAPSSITYGSQQTFTCSGASSNSIYGYYVTRSVTGDLVWAERDASAPFSITTSGDNIKITPAITAE